MQHLLFWPRLTASLSSCFTCFSNFCISWELLVRCRNLISFGFNCWWALRELRKETRNTHYLVVIRLQPPLMVQLEETQDEKTQDPGPRELRNDFSEPRLLHLPIPRKVLNSLTGDICFSFINSNLLFSLHVVIAKIPIYPGIYAGFNISFSSFIWEALSLKMPPDKHNSQLLGCAFFFQYTCFWPEYFLGGGVRFSESQ